MPTLHAGISVHTEKAAKAMSPEQLTAAGKKLLEEFEPIGGKNIHPNAEALANQIEVLTATLKAWDKNGEKENMFNAKAALGLTEEATLSAKDAKTAVTEALRVALPTTSKKLNEYTSTTVREALAGIKKRPSFIKQLGKKVEQLHKTIQPKGTGERMAFGAAEFFLGQMAVMAGADQIGLAINGTKQIQTQQIDEAGRRTILITPQPLPALERVIRATIAVPAIGIGAAAVGFGARGLFFGR